MAAKRYGNLPEPRRCIECGDRTTKGDRCLYCDKLYRSHLLDDYVPIETPGFDITDANGREVDSHRLAIRLMKLTVFLLLLWPSLGHAGRIPPFQFTVPGLWSPGCTVDSMNSVPDTTHVTALVQVRGSWWVRSRTYYDVPRDTPIYVVGMEAPGGWGQAQVRCSTPSAIGCWSASLGVVSMGF